VVSGQFLIDSESNIEAALARMDRQDEPVQQDHGEMDHSEMNREAMDHGDMDDDEIDHSEMDDGEMDHNQMELAQ
jgi:uncharacterized protein involved in copper resistance